MSQPDCKTTVDVREIAPRERHPLIFGTFHQLLAGESMLLVNDHEDTLLLLKRALLKAGFDNILEAGDGREAIRQLGLHPVDLLITDVHMPYLDGWRLARILSRRRWPISSRSVAVHCARR